MESGGSRWGSDSGFVVSTAVIVLSLRDVADGGMRLPASLAGNSVLV